MDLLLVVGVVGALLALAAFVGNEFGWVSADSFVYDLVNFVSALMLLYYALTTRAYPFMITNSVWALVSGVDVFKYLLQRVLRRGAP